MQKMSLFAISKPMENSSNPDDYIGMDGLLYCGKCHTPKQKKIDGTLFPDICRCRQEAIDEEDRAYKREQFAIQMTRNRDDSISCPDAFCYSFAQDDRKESKISDVCQKYVEQWNEMHKNNIGLLFYGNVGTGKSFFASCIGSALLDKQVPVAATNFSRLLNLLQGTIDKQRLLDRLSIYKLLILDDLGVERDSPYAAEQIFNVIDARARSRLPIIVTTNLTLKELEDPNSVQYSRIYDRILELCPVRFKLIGESRRKGNADIRESKARELLLK